MFFVFVLPIENVPLIPGVLSLSSITGLVMALCAIPAFLTRGGITLRKPSAVTLLLAAYVVWAFAGLLWSLDRSVTLVYATTFVQLLVFMLLLAQVCLTVEARRAVQQAYILGCFLAVLDAIRNFYLGNEAVYQRFAVSNTDPNDYALMLALGIPLAWDLFSGGRGWPRFLNLAYLPVALAAIVLSASRGAAVAAAIGLLVVPFGVAGLDRAGRRILLLTALLAAAAVPFFWQEIESAVGSNIERLSTIGDEISHGTLNERSEIWAIGMRAFAQRPLIGMGGGTFPAAVERESGLHDLAHNSYISISVELGAVGIALFVAILVVTIAPLLRGFSARTAPALLVVLVLLIGILSLTWEFRKATWLVIALANMFGGLQLDRLVAGEPELERPAGGALRVGRLWENLSPVRRVPGRTRAKRAGM